MTSTTGSKNFTTARHFCLLLLVGLICLVYKADAASFKINISKPRISEVKTCKVDKSMAIDVCFMHQENGKVTLVDSYKMAALPEGTQCKLKQEGGSLTVVLCEDNDWRLTVLHGKSTQPLERPKRSIGFVIFFYVMILCIIFCRPNHNPQLTCKTIRDVTADKHETSAIVAWETPKAYDPEDGQLSPTRTNGNSPGSRFSEGYHTITYKATDNRGLTTTCQMTFYVGVRRCSMSNTNKIESGTTTCKPASHPNLYGSECFYNCYEGYELVGGDPSSVCDSNERWSSPWPSCRKIICPLPTTPKGKFNCPPTTYYNLTCTLTCVDDYVTAGLTQVKCHADKSWTKYEPCLDKTAPRISCPNKIEALAGHKSSPVPVMWEAPFVSDNSGVSLNVSSDIASGYKFHVGHTNVTFTATDDAKNIATCTMVVIVQRIHCPEYPQLNDSDISCPLIRNEYGSVCVTTCHQGYELANPASDRQECQKNRTWSGDEPVCVPSSCAPPPLVLHGNFDCPDKFVFRSVCHLKCNHGYQITGPANITCGITIQWSQYGNCLDVSAPYFPAGCTDQMKVEAASLGEPTYVIYQLPEVEDNSGMKVTVTGDPVSGSSFSLGTTEVTVTATDLEGNSGNCSFTVLVEYVYCEPPSIDLSGKNLIQYTCPDRHVMGASCGLSCQDGNPVFGASSIRCQRDTDGNLTWAWSGTTRPYCDAKACTKLPEPRNGALVCDSLTTGEMCFLTCNANTTYPANAPDSYRCVASTGEWMPRKDVPSCTVGNSYSDVKMETEFRYFTSSCDVTNEEIKQLFLSRLNKSGLMSECAESGCKLSGIRVTCGPVTRRNRGRRDATTVMYQITLTIDLGHSGKEKKHTETLNHYQNLANSLDDKLYDLEDSGQFQIPEIGEFQSFASSGVTYVCQQPGTKFIYSTLFCAGCGPGHMYDNTTNSCRVCPKDTYQDQDISFSCTPCPNNTVTQAAMATSGALCLDLCRPGQFSHNGIQPCDPCPVGSHQSKYGMKSCDLCPYSMSTVVTGTTSIDDCLFFNTRLSETTSQAAIQIFDKIPTTFTFMTWVTSASTLVTSSLTFSLGSDQDNSNAALLALDKIVLAIREQEDIEWMNFIRKWNHIALSYKSGNVSLYVNGFLTEERSGLQVEDLSQKYVTFRKSEENDVNAVVVSGLQLTTSFYTELQLREFATSCHKKVKTNLLARKPWEFLALSPSTCNDVNMCEKEPCGKHGTCISGLDTLQCLCHTPWSGDRCQVAPDFCADNLCANGATCVIMQEDSTYRCQCAPGYYGTLCKQWREIIHGSWGRWGEWSECSVTCGSGQRSRTRVCDSPAPRGGGEDCIGVDHEKNVCTIFCQDCQWGAWSAWTNDVTCGSGVQGRVRNKTDAVNGGSKCDGHTHEYQTLNLTDCPVNGQFGHWSPWSECSASCGGGVSSRSRACDNPPPKNGGLPCTHSLARESRTCNEQTCRVCPVPEPRTNWKSWNCTDQDGDMISCNIVCKPGMAIVEDVDNIFICGFATNYTWSQQTVVNPVGILPDCTDRKIPQSIKPQITVTIDVNCNDSPTPERFEEAMSNRIGGLECRRENKCGYVIKSERRCGRKRSTGVLVMTVDLEVLGFDDVKADYFSQLSEEEAERQMEHLYTLEKMVKEISDKNETLFSPVVDGVEFKGHVETFQAVVACQEGSGFLHGFCVDCPAGSYSTGNGSCLLCEKGFYQDQAKMSECLPCPNDTTTSGVGAYSMNECTTTPVRYEDVFPLAFESELTTASENLTTTENKSDTFEIMRSTESWAISTRVDTSLAEDVTENVTEIVTEYVISWSNKCGYDCGTTCGARCGVTCGSKEDNFWGTLYGTRCGTTCGRRCGIKCGIKCGTTWDKVWDTKCGVWCGIKCGARCGDKCGTNRYIKRRAKCGITCGTQCGTICGNKCGKNVADIVTADVSRNVTSSAPIARSSPASTQRKLQKTTPKDVKSGN
ncbi:uncharacterized protein LOC131929966 [Physella acuta]|uniref:uncharacterized protein LOC131929966 n=1 Tax=Physella acuta TaxID=109671 RepID=UPI0027DDD889|nr:uncharacterized protein LOC131929966 [Physella acuta]